MNALRVGLMNALSASVADLTCADLTLAGGRR